MATVRAAKESDIPRILELYQQLSFSPPPPNMPRPSAEEYRRVFREMNALHNYDFIVAEEAGEVIGTTVLAILPGMAHGVSPFAVIEYVVVDEKCRGKGIGKQLMEYCIQQAKNASCYKIMLTSDKRRTEAHEFYGSLGFEASAHGFRLYL
jgi:N-acetylglutamate synthase-like GNAT family acetyltransferase